MKIQPNKKIIFTPIRGKNNYEILQNLLEKNNINIKILGIFDHSVNINKGCKLPVKLNPISLNQFIHVIEI